MSRFFTVPMRLPFDANVIRIKERCLKPPHFWKDLDGFYCEPPITKVIVPKTRSAPEGFKSLPDMQHFTYNPRLKILMEALHA